ncbi:DALR anticodon-binding domain-containing protein [Geosporobacter ferrireducens]|uniref:arginine--tRNA ligase n=1 Tax=Geosporobacter ferrireducens TaxID=1424294 RepID=A0A1D8GGY5_9FIRM|nr:DALR anticodon-binding domain-containing protein [Geosporobacter ferrireducens]AOT70171.1 hypothetical protein Gferi_11545 [Geosporobacter ferrireducens]
MKAEIKRQILLALPEIENAEQIEVMEPKNKDHGDFTSNVALKMAKELRKSPMMLAEALAEKIKNNWTAVEVKVITPGFINFYLKEKWLYKVFENVLPESMSSNVKERIEVILKTQEAKELIQEKLLPEEIKRIQYAHSRICSVLEILRSEGICHKGPGISFDYHGSDTEKQILKQLLGYPAMIGQTLENRDSKVLLDYLVGLNNLFYRYHEGLLFRSLNPSLLYGTLKVLASMGRIIGELLGLLGIDAPVKM